jgi:hypothetical protein
MTFTDDDLKRLKDSLSYVQGYSIVKDVWKLPALLARLKAAEFYIERQRADNGYLEALKAWRKAAGK